MLQAIMSHTHIILGAGPAGVGASPDMIQDLGLEGGWGMVDLHIIIAIDHCILHSHYFGVKKCLAQRFCVVIRKKFSISIGRILRCYTKDFFPTIIILGMCSYMQNHSSSYGNNFA